MTPTLMPVRPGLHRQMLDFFECHCHCQCLETAIKVALDNARRRFHCEESGSDGTLGHLPSTEYTLGKCGVPSGAGAMAADLAPDLRKRIEIMAEHIARNGSEFESTVRQKNMNNPDFGFLYDGEGASYYLDVLAAHRARTRSGPDSQSLLASLRRWPEPILYPLVAEAEQQLSEVVASLEQMASRDAIRNGRAWIESNAALAPQIAGSLVKRIRTLPTASHRIHVLYLVHDVLQTQAAKKERIQALVCAFKPYLVWLLRPAYQFALSGQREEEGQRALRLLQLWVERGILAPAEAEEMQTLIVAPELPALPDTAAQMPARVRPALPRPASTPLPGMTPAGVSSGVAPRGPVANRFMPGQAVAGSRGGYGAGPGGTGPGLIPFPFPGRPYQVHLGMHTAEQLPVGVMATMMLHAKRQKKTARLDFVPYMPLERVRTLPPMEPLTTRLMDRVEDFYADLRDDDRSSSSSSSRSRRSRSRSRSSRGSQRSRVSSRSRGDAPVPNPMCAVPPPAVE